MPVNGSIRLLVQFFVSPDVEPLSGFDCTYICELRHEWPDSDPRGVGLDDAEHVPDEAGRHPEPRAHAAYAAVARGHERVGACTGLDKNTAG